MNFGCIFSLIGPGEEGEDTLGSRETRISGPSPGCREYLQAQVGGWGSVVSGPLGLPPWQRSLHSPLWSVCGGYSLAVAVCLRTAAHSQGCRQCQGAGPPLWAVQDRAGPNPSRSCGLWCALRPEQDSGSPRRHCQGRILPLGEDSRRPTAAW